jgi:hypothetical protein
MHGHTSRSFRGTHVAAVRASDRCASRWLSDEVIVDFPSVEPAVDRMRSAFLAEDCQQPLSTAIQLTSRDAFDGVTLPLTVPVRCTCRGCGGRGESWTESCRTCNGSGAELLRCELQVTVPAGVTDGTWVRFTLVPPQSPPTRVELRIAVD